MVYIRYAGSTASVADCLSPMLARDAIALVGRTESASIVNHRVRPICSSDSSPPTYACRMATTTRTSNCFAACVLHDRGLADDTTSGDRLIFSVFGVLAEFERNSTESALRSGSPQPVPVAAPTTDPQR